MSTTTHPEALVKFHALRISLRLIRLLRPLVEKIRRKSPKLLEEVESGLSREPAKHTGHRKWIEGVAPPWSESVGFSATRCRAVSRLLRRGSG
jgi:hypothetical protein